MYHIAPYSTGGHNVIYPPPISFIKNNFQLVHIMVTPISH